MVSTTVTQLSAEPCASNRPDAAINPTAIGTRPRSIIRSHGWPKSRARRREKPKAIRLVGTVMAAEAVSIPRMPPTCQPNSPTTSTFGPGAACARAKRRAKSASLIQPCTSTTMRCISGSTAMPPPTETSEMAPKPSSNCQKMVAVICCAPHTRTREYQRVPSPAPPWAAARERSPPPPAHKAQPPKAPRSASASAPS